VISSEGNILHIQVENTGGPFTIDIKIIRRRIGAIGKNKSAWPDCLWRNSKTGWGCLVQLLDITMNNSTLPGDWKRATVIPIHKGGD